MKNRWIHFGESWICYLIHVVYLNIRRLIHPGRTGAAVFIVPFMAAVKFLLNALGVWRKYSFLVSTSTILSKCYQRHRPLPAKCASKMSSKYFRMNLNFQHQNGGFINISKLIFVHSSVAKLSTTGTTEKTEPTTCKSIDLLFIKLPLCLKFCQSLWLCSNKEIVTYWFAGHPSWTHLRPGRS